MTNVSSLRPVRHDYITDLVVREGAVEIAALSAALGVSAATIRRDIESLEHCGVVRRVHGGAVRAGSRTVETDAVEGPPEPPAAPRAAQDAGLAALAAACAAAVTPGTTVAVSGGTAAAAVAPAVARARPAVVVTHDLAVVRAVRDASTDAAPDATSTPSRREVDVCLAPGILTRRGTVVGPAAVRALAAHRPAIAFIGTAAIRGNDVVAADHWEAEICQALIACASDAVLLADPAALRGAGLVTFATLEEFSAVLTGQSPPRVDTPARSGPPRQPAPAGPTPRSPAAATGKDEHSCPSCRSRP